MAVGERFRKEKPEEPEEAKWGRWTYLLLAALAGWFLYVLGEMPVYTYFEEGDAVFGEPVNGLEAGIKVLAASEHFGAYDLEVTVRNAGEAPVTILNVALLSLHNAKHVEVEGRNASKPRYQSRSTAGQHAANYVVLEPGQEITAAAQHVCIYPWFENSDSFDARVNFVFRNEDEWLEVEDARTERPIVLTGLWTGEVRSGKVHVWRGKPWLVGFVRLLLVILVFFLLSRAGRRKPKKRPAEEPPEEPPAEAEGAR